MAEFSSFVIQKRSNKFIKFSVLVLLPSKVSRTFPLSCPSILTALVISWAAPWVAEMASGTDAVTVDLTQMGLTPIGLSPHVEGRVVGK